MPTQSDIEKLQERVVEFGKKRNWQQFHNPKNVASALSVEASELLEIFQWLTDEESANLGEIQLENAAQEAADIFMYLLLFCARTDINLHQATLAKLEHNERRFPVAKE